MKQLDFDWDSKKNISNKKKHGISFEEAETVFHDPNGRLISDPDHSDNEDRFILLGLSENLRILVVCHCYRHGDTLIRIISAKKADRKETKIYEEYLK